MDGDLGRERLSGVGSLLRACRLRAGVSVADAAEVLNIRRSYLDAIEEERYGDLPRGPYAAGFVRGYAEYLGLDGGEIVRRFKAEMMQPDGAAARTARRRRKIGGSGGKRAADLNFPLATSETATPSGSVLLVGAMLALFAYGGWYVLSASDGLVSERVAPLPERLAALLPDRVSSQHHSSPEKRLADPGGQPVDSGGTSAIVPDGEPSSASAFVTAAKAIPDPAVRVVASDADLTDPPAVNQGTADASAATLPVGDIPVGDIPVGDISVGDIPAGEVAAGEVAAGEVPAGGPAAAADRPRFRLEAAEESWVEIRDRFDKRILGRLLVPGDVIDVPDQAGLRLTVGNAGGLVIRIDGDPVPPLGRSGMVLRDVPLESARLQQAVISAN